MRLLLDTHAFLWFTEGNPHLPEPTRAVIASRANEAFVSIASFWEIAIKVNLGKLQLSQPLPALFEAAQQNFFEVMPIHPETLYQLACLKQHHRDPFDHLLIATALTEKLTIITVDRHFQAYGALTILWG